MASSRSASETRPRLIAGPCSAENRRQVLDTARGVAAAGAGAFRAGLWKPRTRPGNFEGVGAAGLPWLEEARELTGLPLATEVASAAHVALCLEAGVDILWIGARTTANPFAVQEIADALRGCGDKVEVIVKNPLSPDLEAWIGAIERIRGAGVGRITAVHRGFSYLGPHIYRNRPEWRVPIELRRRMPELQVLVDPSHIGGSRDLVPDIARQALDMGFDGLMVESHCDPGSALSDSAQQLTPDELLDMMRSLVGRYTGVVETDVDTLDALRAEIDTADRELLEVLARRMAVSARIGGYKRLHGLPVLQKERYDTLMGSRISEGERLGLRPEFLRLLLQAIHEESVYTQTHLSD